MKHPCENKCSNYNGEQCKTCLVPEPERQPVSIGVLPDKYITVFEKSSEVTHAPMDKEARLTLTLGDLVIIHDALSQVASKMNDKEFADIFCTIDAIEAAIVSNSHGEK